MSAPLRDLDDVDGLIAADREGLLRAAATSGAHVRAVAQASSEGVLTALTTARPRAVVVVTGGSLVARRAADFTVALIAAHLDTPLVVAPSLPGWVGPLDIVVLAGDDPGDRHYYDAALRALRRRAELVVAVPVEGPLADAVGTEKAVDLSPRLPVDPRFGFARLVAVLVAVCVALEAVRLHPAPPLLSDVADAIDAEAAADHPGNETFHNQAKLLALRLDGRPVVWAGDTPGAAVVAEHSAAVAFAVAGVASASVDEPVAVARARHSAASGTSGVDSIFYDPDFDPAPPATTPRTLLVTTAGRSWAAHRRIAGLTDVDVLTEEAVAEPETAESANRDERFVDSPADLTAYLTLAVRADLAAAYLELTGATSR